MKLSPIITSYDHQRYIERILQSIEERTLQGFQIGIIGDADGIIEVAKRLICEH